MQAMRDYAMVIDGRLVETSERHPVINPALGEPFATCAWPSPSHVDDAVAAAERALPAWRKDEAQRRAKLRQCAEVIRARASDIIPLLTQEQGKPLAQAGIEAYGSAIWFDHFAGLALEPEVLEDGEDKRVTVLRKPHGVVAAITPWNFPVILLAWKLAPALLAGNTVVAKPSPFTPLSTLLLADVLREVLPPGVFNVVTGDGAVGAALTKHPGVRKISFTGSVATGKTVMRAASDDVKRVTLEMGGNDPAIVLDDANPDAIVDGLFWGAFMNSGQVCVAIKRLYLPASLHDRVVAGLVERARTVKVGNGLDADTKLGPINNEPQVSKLAAMVDDARKDGAKIEVGGARASGKGYFFPPTIVTEARASMRLVDEEQFGTALPVIRYTSLDDALEQASRTHYGLGASVWTSNTERGAAIVSELECGTGWVNQHPDFGPHVPFGGAKWSGIGYENGRRGYEEFTRAQVLSVKKDKKS
jgi:acyl-CoA reductase-like NAD-dependent aldehyde dehydrogenase